MKLNLKKRRLEELDASDGLQQFQPTFENSSSELNNSNSNSNKPSPPHNPVRFLSSGCGIRTCVKKKEPHVHSGFWNAYEAVREDLHRLLRKALVDQPVEQVCFAGQSLGGALSALAAVDFAVNSAPRINHYYTYQNRKRSSDAINSLEIESTESSPCFYPSHDLKLSMYSFGAPRFGNSDFFDFYNKHVPDSFRVVVDGDIVTSLPYSIAGFKHIGLEVLIDPFGAGSIIVDPSFVERRLRGYTKTSVSAHTIAAYYQGLVGITEAARYLDLEIERQQAGSGGDHRDSIALAMSAAPLVKGNVDSNSEIKNPFHNGRLSTMNSAKTSDAQKLQSQVTNSAHEGRCLSPSSISELGPSADFVTPTKQRECGDTSSHRGKLTVDVSESDSEAELSSELVSSSDLSVVCAIRYIHYECLILEYFLYENWFI
jgi:hypothetical protein